MDPSDNACIEYLRPKTIPEELVALGTVVQVSEIQVKLQITGGIICLVDRLNVSQSYTELLEEYSKEDGGSHEIPARLSQMFHRGQQYVCKIIEKRPRKGYADAQDIIATLNPSNLQEENLPKTLLAIPQVPLQCAVRSIEDHGYQMDIGFQGLTGFLTFEESDYYCKKNNSGKKLFIGQIVRCCLRAVMKEEDESRVVHLGLSKDLMKKSAFSQDKVSQNVLTEKCILPGSTAFLTVMKVRKDGLEVNFLNEFAGFVGIHHLKEEWDNPRKNYKISDKFKCSVLYYNKITNTFALSLRTKAAFRNTLKHFISNYHVGQFIKTARVAYIDGTKAVAFKVENKYKAVANVRDALEEDISTMASDEIHLALDSNFPDGSKHKCRVKSINLADLMLVLSLRQEFLDLPFVSAEELKPGAFIEVTIKKYVKDGIVVTFGLNLRAIILNVDLNDYLVTKSYKGYPIGKKIQCRVLKVDLTKQPARVYLTNKGQLMNPDMTVIDSYDRSFQRQSVYCTVVKISPTGVIVELFNNVKGFIPRRFLSSAPIKSIEDVFQIGQVISCVVYRVDPNRRSVMLGAVPLEDIIRMKKKKKAENKTKKEMKALARIESKLAKKTPDKKLSGAKKRQPETENDDPALAPLIKSRRQRSEEAKLREEKIRENERILLDPDRPPQSIPDFEKLVLKTPNSAEAWIKYSKFFLDNVETEKARIICRRALKTINFRLEAEKLKIWLFLIKIEAKFGGTEQLREMIDEASQTNDRLKLYQGSAKVLSNCGELNEAEILHESMLKSNSKLLEVWIEYILFVFENRKDLDKARSLFEKACRSLMKSDLVVLKSRFAQFEFRYGDVERGKTMFENLLSDNPKRTDLWKVYESMVRKFGTRQVDTPEVREQNEQTLQRIAESIELVSKKVKKNNKLADNSTNGTSK